MLIKIKVNLGLGYDDLQNMYLTYRGFFRKATVLLCGDKLSMNFL